MIAVGIDVSKSKSTVAILNSNGSLLVKPYTMTHTQSDMCALVDYLCTFDEPITILMEYTGHYHYPVLKKLQQEGFPVCIINPYQMKKYADVEIHKAKTDKKMLSELLHMLWKSLINSSPITHWSRSMKI